MTATAVVTTCYDRWEHLERTLRTWRALDGAPPIFVGTYAGDEVPSWLGGVHLVTVDDEPFHRTRLRNCVSEAARRACDPRWLLFVDADVEVVDPALFTRPLRERAWEPDYVVDSPWALLRDMLILLPEDPERADPGKRGTHLVRSDLFFMLGGWDQRLTGWGVEDRNLYGRYAATSDRVAYFDRAGLVHIDHDDELRVRHNPGGVGRVASMLTNLRRHMAEPDPRGASWRDDFGYPRWSVRELPPVGGASSGAGGAAGGAAREAARSS